MAEASTAEMWQRIAIQIEQYYTNDEGALKENLEAYFNWFTTEENIENPLTGIDPNHDKFFGPKVCLLFIIGKPYGESGEQGSQSISWPPPGFANSKDRLKKFYKQWTKFELHFWGDGIIIQKVKDADNEAGTKFESLMIEVFNKMEDECNDMSKYGWKWHGRLNSEPPINTFTDILDKFYGLNSK